MSTMVRSDQNDLSGTLHGEMARQILARLAEIGAVPGDHIAAQGLADAFNVSRSPIYAALEHLASEGILRKEPRRGFFLAVPVDEKMQLRSAPDRKLDKVYFQIADDRLAGALGNSVSENQLRQLYGLSSAEVRSVLNRILQEGWIERRLGYGWTFSTMLTTSDALMQTYRLRAVLEPAGLREPTFQIATASLDTLEAAERSFLDGGIHTMSPEELYKGRVNFHETLAKASGNPFILDALKRVNRIRRLLAYRANLERQRHFKQTEEHLEIIELLRLGRNEDAAISMHHHINTVMFNLEKLGPNFFGPDELRR